MNYLELGKFVESLMGNLVKGEIEGNEFVQCVHKKIQELKEDIKTTETLVFTCNYDEESFDTYKGIVVENLLYEILDIINTGDVNNDLEAAYEKYKHHLIIQSTSIDNYRSDLMSGKELSKNESHD